MKKQTIDLFIVTLIAVAVLGSVFGIESHKQAAKTHAWHCIDGDIHGCKIWGHSER